jgi:hypothetical protein
VLVGHGGAVKTSPNLTTWTTATIAATVSTTDLYLVAFGNDRWVVMGNTLASATGAFLATSADGVVWIGLAYTELGGSIGFSSLTFADSLFRAGTTGVGYILTSTDGENWTAISSPFGQISVIANLNHRWLAAGYGSGQYSTTATATDVAASSDLEDDLATPPAGGFITCLAEGYLRLGATPAGLITCDATEGATSADRTVAQLWKRMLVDRAGLVAGTDTSAADVTALDVALPGEAGVWYGPEDRVSISAALDELIGTDGNWWLPDRSGLYRIKQLVAPSGTAAATFTGAKLKTRLQRTATIDPGEGVPAWKVILYYSKNHTVQDSGLAGGVDDDTRADVAREWRSVTSEDASIKTKHLLAPTLTVYTRLANAADAQTECDRLLALRKVQRDRYPVVVEATATNSALDHGNVVTLQHDRFGLSAGKKFVLVGVKPQPLTRDIALELWGGV